MGIYGWMEGLRNEGMMVALGRGKEESESEKMAARKEYHLRTKFRHGRLTHKQCPTDYSR